MSNNNINKDNYAAYVVDYYDHRLSDRDQHYLLNFLKQHPDLWDEFVAYGDTIDVHEAIETPDFSFLKKAIPNASNEESFMVDEVEGTLDPRLQATWQAYLEQHPDSARTLSYYHATVLPKEVVYLPKQVKDGLKKPLPRPVIVWRRMAVAASLLAILGAGIWLNNRKINQPFPIPDLVFHTKPIGPPILTPEGLSSNEIPAAIAIKPIAERQPKVEKITAVVLLPRRTVMPVIAHGVEVPDEVSAIAFAYQPPVQVSQRETEGFLTPKQWVEQQVLMRAGIKPEKAKVLRETGIHSNDVLAWISDRLHKRGGKLQLEQQPNNPQRYELSFGKFSLAAGL